MHALDFLELDEKYLLSGKVTVEEWLDMDFGGIRTELIDGCVLPKECDSWDCDPEMMGSTTQRHNDIANHLHLLLHAKIQAGQLPCKMHTAGVRVVNPLSPPRGFEPDLAISCKDNFTELDKTIVRPCMVIEIVSPSSFERDHGKKVKGYLACEHLNHYLIVDPTEREVVHCYYAGDILRRDTLPATSKRTITLDPPGITVTAAELFGDLLPPETASESE